MTDHSSSSSSSSSLLAMGDALAALVEAASPSLLRVVGARRPATATVWSDHLAVVPAHVLGRRDEGFVETAAGERRAAKVIGRDPTSDVALLRIEGAALTPATWDDGEGAKVGHLVVAAAMPGDQPRATLGMLSGLGGAWTTRLGAPMARLIDVDGELPRGFAGGPLLTADGKALGMNTHGLMRGGTTVPTATLRRVVAQLEEHGGIRPGYIGVAVQAAALGEEAQKVVGRERALLVTGVVDDGPASAAKIAAGDLLTAAGDQPLTAVEDLLAAVAGRCGEALSFAVLRGSELTTVEVTVGERPAPRGRHGHHHGRPHHRGHRSGGQGGGPWGHGPGARGSDERGHGWPWAHGRRGRSRDN